MNDLINNYGNGNRKKYHCLNQPSILWHLKRDCHRSKEGRKET